MAFLIFAVTGAQSYSLAAGTETLQPNQESLHNTSEKTGQETLNDESSNLTEDFPLVDEGLIQNNFEETQLDENYHNVNIGDLDNTGDDVSLEASLAALPWIGMNLGRLLGWLAGGAVVVDLTKTGMDVLEFSKELDKSKEKEKPKYFKVSKTKTTLIIKEPLTEQQAIDWLSDLPERDLWTPTYNDALNIASKVAKLKRGKVTPSQNHFSPEGYKDTKYFNHFHAESVVFRTGHIWYGNTGLWGKK